MLEGAPPMRVSYRWLTELLPKLNREPEEVADALTAVGLAVDGVFDHGAALRPLVLAEVVRVQPHPQRDSLQLVTVRTEGGVPRSPMVSLPPLSTSSSRPLQFPGELTVVCGAKNVPAPGWLVVLAGIGTKLPGVDFVLTRREIGGIVSEGMLCSESELGLADASDGIITLPPGSAEPGARFIDIFPEARDFIFELDITPNRPDALGHYGVARDLGAFFEYELASLETSGLLEGGALAGKSISVSNEAKERCPRYAAGIVRGVRIGSSPANVRWRLHRLGIRPISNAVDVTNWLLLEQGQPLHAFDLRKVRGEKLVVRLAAPGEKMVTLDGQARELGADDLLICDGSGPTALAGIMGGADSEISATTQDVVVECAYFAPRGVRRTARRQGMHTESSHRFERGVDHGATEKVLLRALSLLTEWCGGIAAPGLVTDHGEKPPVPTIEFRGERMDQLLGVDVPFREATRVLARLGFTVEYARDTKTGQAALIRGASHRPDVSIEADLIEEVARIRGLDNIPTVLPSIPPQEPRTSGRLERKASTIAVELGLSEALTYSFVAASDLKAISAPESVVTLENPLTEERSVLRTSLLSGLLEALRRARRRGESQISLFAVGAVFLPVGSAHKASEARPRTVEDRSKLPYEEPRFAAVLAGERAEYLAMSPGLVDVYDAKGIAVEMVERMIGKTPHVEHASGDAATRHLHPRGAARLSLDGITIGYFGPLHPDVVESLDLDGPALAVELSLGVLETFGNVIPKYQALPKLPGITRDLSLVVADATLGSAVLSSIREAAGPLCESVDIVTEFRGGPIPAGHRSLTFRIVYRDPLARKNADAARTLTDKEVDEVQSRVLGTTSERFGAVLRG